MLAAKFKALGDPTRLQIISALRKAAPQAICQLMPSSEAIGLLVNRTVAPFDNAELRRAMALAIDSATGIADGSGLRRRSTRKT